MIEAPRAAENESNRNSSEAARRGPCLPFVFLSWRNGAATTTVDHADIRGLVTACLAFVVELPLARIGSFAGSVSHNRTEGSPTGAASSMSGNF